MARTRRLSRSARLWLAPLVLSSALFGEARAVAAQVATARTAAPGTPTFTRDVAPLLFAHCATCHRPGEVGGFSLLAFADARPRAAAIARAVRTRAMPPWKPDPLDGAALVGARRLDDQSIDTIVRWAEAGGPEGEPSDLPSVPTFPDGWRLGTPDLVVSMSAPYALPPGGADVLRNFIVPIPLVSSRFVRGLEFRPDNPKVVHHANIRVDPFRRARALDAEDAAPGFDGRLSGGSEFPDGQFLGWTPGQLPPMLDGDAAWRLDAGSDFVVQLHMRPTERTETVQVRIGLFFTDTPPRHTPVMIRLGRQNLDIPAGAADYRSDDSFTLPVDVRLLAVQPHAHVRAREVTASAVLPDGSVRRLLHIADWDFDWQDQYRYVEPIVLPAGTVLRTEYRYDNSRGNRRNPDYPPRRVRWGQETSDEMGDVWFQVIADDEPTRSRLVADAGHKVLTEDAIGYETLLESEQSNPRLHEAAAAILLTLGQVDRGIAHLQAALRLDPQSIEAHYNLATALAWQGQSTEAIANLNAVLASDPTHVQAHVNLGAMLRAKGDLDGAAAHLERALELDPSSAAAHANLAGVLMRQHEISRGVSEYREALAHNSRLVEPLTELAWTLATSPNPQVRDSAAAIAFGERARTVTGGHDARALDALAAAYAAGGRYDDAVRTIGEALALVPPGAPGGADTRRLLDARRALYLQHRPFVDPARN
jgi:tetratricopeptide (TPR) repeat protein/mono/diheme cytochrome c family protein